MHEFEMYADRQANLNVPNQIFRPEELEVGSDIAIVGIILPETKRTRAVTALAQLVIPEARLPGENWREAICSGWQNNGRHGVYPKVRGSIKHLCSEGALLEVDRIQPPYMHARDYLGVDPRDMQYSDGPAELFQDFPAMGLSPITRTEPRETSDYHSESYADLRRGKWHLAATLLLRGLDA